MHAIPSSSSLHERENTSSPSLCIRLSGLPSALPTFHGFWPSSSSSCVCRLASELSPLFSFLPSTTTTMAAMPPFLPTQQLGLVVSRPMIGRCCSNQRRGAIGQKKQACDKPSWHISFLGGLGDEWTGHPYTVVRYCRRCTYPPYLS